MVIGRIEVKAGGKFTKAQIKSFKLQDGDIVVMRWCSPTRQELEAGQAAITEAIAATGVRAIGVCVGDHIEIDAIPLALSTEALETRAMLDLATMQGRLHEVKQRLSGICKKHNHEVKELRGKAGAQEVEMTRRYKDQIKAAEQRIDQQDHELQKTRQVTKKFPRLSRNDVKSWSLDRLRELGGRPCDLKGCRYYQGYGSWCLTHEVLYDQIKRRERYAKIKDRVARLRSDYTARTVR